MSICAASKKDLGRYNLLVLCYFLLESGYWTNFQRNIPCIYDFYRCLTGFLEVVYVFKGAKPKILMSIYICDAAMCWYWWIRFIGRQILWMINDVSMLDWISWIPIYFICEGSKGSCVNVQIIFIKYYKFERRKTKDCLCITKVCVTVGVCHMFLDGI